MSHKLPVAPPNDARDAGDAPAPCVCRLLRTKTAYSTYTSTGEAWETGASTTAVYWCLGTMGPAGPDDGFAHPHSCRAGRACFQLELE